MSGYRHYGWPVSPYSAKTRSYLRFKRIAFQDVVPNALTLFGKIKKAVGRPIMPTLQRPDGTWLQDTSEIIDALERVHPEPSITPPGGAQRVASLLLELHADEWLPASALHTRWNIPKNARFAVEEFSRYGLPGVPRFVGARLIRPMAKQMAGYLPILGVTAATIPGVERFTKELIAQLDTHLAEHDYLLGTRPCMGDFALFGPLWSHTYRDPGSTYLFDDAPAVRAWMDRLLEGGSSVGSFLADDAVPTTLDPVFRTLFEEQWPFVERLVAAIDTYCDENPTAHRVPRALGRAPFTMGGCTGDRKLITFTQWMVQRPLDAYAALDESERQSADAWLERVGGREAMQLQVAHPFERSAFKMRLRPASRSTIV